MELSKGRDMRKRGWFWLDDEYLNGYAKHLGTSTKGPITAVKACPEFIPKTAIATAIASSKLFPEAVKAIVVVFL